MKIEYDKLWQGSSVGESARLIPVRSRVRISPLLIKKGQDLILSLFYWFVEFDEYSIKSSSDLRAECILMSMYCFRTDDLCILMSGLGGRIKWKF